MNDALPSGVEVAVRLRLACETQDPSIAEHLDHVTRYSCEIGTLMGLPLDQITELLYGAPLHDIGKIGLPLSLLNKPGKLTPEEMEEIKKHTVMGYNILSGSDSSLIQCAADIALSHHECWNGSGYPHGLAKEKIPLAARIVSVADVYDALLSQRAYKPAWGNDFVVTEMKRLGETKFDPAILKLFLDNIAAVTMNTR